MKRNRLNVAKTRKIIATLHGVLCPHCHGTEINPKTSCRCFGCHHTRSVRL